MAYDPIKAATSGGPLSLNVPWYAQLLETKPSWKLVSTQYIKPNTGIAVDVPAGHTIRITQAEGPQINDINFFGADIKDASGERYDLGYTLAIEGMLLTRFARAWSRQRSASDSSPFRRLSTPRLSQARAYPGLFASTPRYSDSASPGWSRSWLALNPRITGSRTISLRERQSRKIRRP